MIFKLPEKAAAELERLTMLGLSAYDFWQVHCPKVPSYMLPAITRLDRETFAISLYRRKPVNGTRAANIVERAIAKTDRGPFGRGSIEEDGRGDRVQHRSAAKNGAAS